MKRELTVSVNGIAYTLMVEGNRTLLEFLRHDIGLTGAKSACELGECGACTVLMNGAPINSCLVLAHEADGQEILTIEGLSEGGELHPIQRAFINEGAIQCGFCTPGMIMSTKALLDKNPDAGPKDIREGLLGNICRCTGYVKVIRAVEATKDLLKRRK